MPKKAKIETSGASLLDKNAPALMLMRSYCRHVERNEPVPAELGRWVAKCMGIYIDALGVATDGMPIKSYQSGQPIVTLEMAFGIHEGQIRAQKKSYKDQFIVQTVVPYLLVGYNGKEAIEIVADEVNKHLASYGLQPSAPDSMYKLYGGLTDSEDYWLMADLLQKPEQEWFLLDLEAAIASGHLPAPRDGVRRKRLTRGCTDGR